MNDLSKHQDASTQPYFKSDMGSEIVSFAGEMVESEINIGTTVMLMSSEKSDSKENQTTRNDRLGETN